MEKSTKLSIILIIVGFLASAFVVLVVSLQIDPDNAPKVVSFILTFIVLYFLTTQINTVIQQSESRKKHEELQSLATSAHQDLKSLIKRGYGDIETLFTEREGLKFIGDMDNFIVHMQEKLRLAISVENTRISVPGVNNYSINYELKYGENISQQVASFINSGKEWTEICSADGARRLETVDNLISRKKSYVVYTTNSPIPVMNFIILTYPNRSREVFLGFAMHSYEDMNIYSSRNVDIVTHFHNFFAY